MRAALATLALFPAFVLAEITINTPSGSSYWVQNETNTIAWTYSQGDPSPVSIVVVNSENTTLNGAYSIAEFVPVSQQSVTVTNVTLRPGSNYQVQFVNGTNQTQVYASSASFDVRDPGTQPAPSGSASASSSAASGSATSASGSASGTSSGEGAQATDDDNGALGLMSSSGIASVAVVGCITALSGLLL